MEAHSKTLMRFGTGKQRFAGIDNKKRFLMRLHLRASIQFFLFQSLIINNRTLLTASPMKSFCLLDKGLAENHFPNTTLFVGTNPL